MKKIFILVTVIVLLGAGCDIGQPNIVQEQQDKIDELNNKVEELTQKITPNQTSPSTTSPTSIVPTKPIYTKPATVQKKAPIIHKEEDEVVPLTPITTPSASTDVKANVVEVPPSPPLLSPPPSPSAVDAIVGKYLNISIPADIYTYTEAKTKYDQMSAQWVNGEIDSKIMGPEMDLFVKQKSIEDGCKITYGIQAYADVNKSLCYCGGGYIMDDITGKCSTYEQFCRNLYGGKDGDNGFYKDYKCYYCPTGYILQRGDQKCYKI